MNDPTTEQKVALCVNAFYFDHGEKWEDMLEGKRKDICRKIYTHAIKGGFWNKVWKHEWRISNGRI